MYLAAPADLVPQPEFEPGPPALGAWSLSHWTFREVPMSSNSSLGEAFRSPKSEGNSAGQTGYNKEGSPLELGGPHGGGH